MRNEHVLQLDNRKCTPNSEHSLDEKLVDLVKKKQKPFEMKNLLKEMRKPDLGLERFGESKIKRDMDRKELKPGAQIWVYHDSQSNPCNLVARWNAYAHVVIYIGEERGTSIVVMLYTCRQKIFEPEKPTTKPSIFCWCGGNEPALMERVLLPE